MALSSAAVQALVGTPIRHGWTITEELPRAGDIGAEDLTGGCFSIGCIAERTKGTKTERAFVKVIDLNRAAAAFPGNVMAGLKLASDAYTVECAILDVCKTAHLDRIIQVLDVGELPARGGGLATPYILFENADGDLRKVVSRSGKFDDAWKLRVLHDVAVGLQQLHLQKIAHQDLKPSNVLIFNDDGQGAKIGDLGRSSRQGLSAPHDRATIAGARAYAPPEQAFGISAERWEEQREGCDLYHLGMLAFYLFAGRVPNDYYRTNLPAEILPVIWGGLGRTDYETALPFLTKALTEFVALASIDFPEWGRDELAAVVFNACTPDYLKRGDPEARQRVGHPLGIEVFVSRFDRLSRRALVSLKR